MPSNTINSFRSWTAEKGFDLSPAPETPEVATASSKAKLLLLCAKVTPSKDAVQLFESLEEALNFASSNNLEGSAPVQALMADNRLPGWLRLATALALGDLTQVSALKQHVPALTEHYADSLVDGWKPTVEAFNSLSSTQRLRLMNSGLYVETTFTPEEIIATLEEIKDQPWTVYPANIRFHTVWGDDFPAAVKHMSTIGDLAGFDPETTFSFASRLFAETNQMTAGVEDLRLALDLMAGLLNKIERKAWPTNVPDLQGANAASLLLSPSSPREPHYRHLAGICAYARGEENNPMLHPVLLAALVDPDSSWVLPSLLQGASSLEIMPILALMPEDPSGDDSVIFDLASYLSESDFQWLMQPGAEALYESLHPRYARRSLYSAVSALASRSSDGALSAFQLIPDWAVEVIAEHMPDTEGMTGRAGLAKAHAYLITRGYTPKAQTPLPSYSHWESDVFYTELSKMLLADDLGQLDTASREVALAWIRRMSSYELNELMAFTDRYKSDHNASGPLSSIVVQVIEEALALCVSPEVQKLLLLELNDPAPAFGKKMNLSTFAKGISNTIKNTKA